LSVEPETALFGLCFTEGVIKIRFKILTDNGILT